MQKLTKFKVIFDLFTVCVYFIQQQNCKLYYIYLMIISEIQSEIGHCSCDNAKFKAPADFSHHAILCMTLSLTHRESPIIYSICGGISWSFNYCQLLIIEFRESVRTSLFGNKNRCSVRCGDIDMRPNARMMI